MYNRNMLEKALSVQKEMAKIFGENEVFLVGGSVRDLLLEKEPKDWDFTTPLTPDEISSKIKAAGRRTYEIGSRFGTVGFKLPFEGEFIYVEVTTFRSEVYQKDSRKPSVEFIKDLDADLARRDFTINAMVLKDDGTIYDPYGGKLDILVKQIKAVGIPKDRITEDPLRMLRAARFSSQLGFNVEPNFFGKARQLSPFIYTVSRERWIQEMDKILGSKKPSSGILFMLESGLMKFILPEVHQWFFGQTNIDAEAWVSALDVDVSDKVKDESEAINMKWSVLLHHIADPVVAKEKGGDFVFPNFSEVRRYMIDGICDRLRFSKERKTYLTR